MHNHFKGFLWDYNIDILTLEMVNNMGLVGVFFRPPTNQQKVGATMILYCLYRYRGLSICVVDTGTTTPDTVVHVDSSKG